MAAKDLFHNAVKNALQKEQWLTTAAPLKIKIDGVKFEIDLAAEKVLAAEETDTRLRSRLKVFSAPL